MKFLLATISFALSMSMGAMSSQEPPLPAQTGTPNPSPPSSVSPTPLAVEPPQIVPESPAAKVAPILSDLDAAFLQSPLTQASQEYRLHIEWRQLQNRTMHDPEVEAARQAAARAKTDLEKRARLRDYYKIYYAHMQARATAADVKAYLEEKKAEELKGLAQERVRPTPTPKLRHAP